MLRSLLALAAVAVAASAPLDAQNFPMCPGDGTQLPACPCQNNGTSGNGCENSASTGGARLSHSGTSSPDTIVFHVTGELPSVLSILYQADARQGSAAYGDGITCLAGNIRKLYVKHASAGMVTFPGASDPSISARSAALGDTIPAGGFRYYHVGYRDRLITFCPGPLGGTWNATNHYQITW